MSQDGPGFAAMDNDAIHGNFCYKFYQNTGWWFDTTEVVCGKANLNGVRYECSNAPPIPEINTYLEWYGNPLHAVQMWLRPKNSLSMTIEN
ncbi:hypothetical protein L596_005007 [Steinernema carpocapsae]|uniref:Uncharacterized protein n=1 Tax=Steinernema carpocapsae TaxID=34508 RepID=A0A4U8UXK1_STECR|nr:hypothetical protein L596_005007 [Steinernema carpocapsae]